MTPYELAQAKIGHHRYENCGGSRRANAEHEGVDESRLGLTEFEEYEAPMLEREVADHRTGPVFDEGCAQQHSVRQYDRTAEHNSEQRQRRHFPWAETNQPRTRALATDHRISAPAHDRSLCSEQHDGDQQQRQRRCGCKSELRRKLEQTPDLRGPVSYTH